MPFLNKNGIKYNLDSNDKTEQTALATEFDSAITYSIGDLVMYNGELYRCDSTGTPFPLNPIAQAPFTVSRDGRVLAESMTVNDSDYFVSDDIIQLNANTTYVLEIPSEQVGKKYSGNVNIGFCTYTRTGTYGDRVNYPYSSTNITFTPTTSCYLSLSILKGYESEYKLYGTSTSKFVKVDVDTLLGEKAATADLVSNITNVLHLLAADYSSSSTYDEGDYVIYNNLLYKCNTTISVAEVFDSTKWDQTTITALIKAIEGQLN